MTNEAKINSSFVIVQPGGLGTYRSNVPSFSANVVGSEGPSPGGVLITTAGISVSFTPLTTPALCELINYDPTNYFEWGVWDSVHSEFIPIGEVLPGEGYIVRLSRRLGYVEGLGTGTTGSGVTLRLKAHTASINGYCGAFQA